MTQQQALTPELVRFFFDDAVEEHECSIVDKNDSTLMKAVAKFLDAFGITDHDDFMKSFTTTIGRKIYIPFEVGVPGDYSLEDQVDTLVHELVHVQQYQDDEVGFVLGYCLNRSSRAEYEAQAYSADMAMHYWRTGEIYDIPARAQLLENYALQQEHIDFAARYMESISLTIQEGATVNDIVAWSIQWFEDHGVYGAARG